MPNIDIKSQNLPALVAECARLLMQAEAGLAAPVSRIQMAFGSGILTISGFVAGALSTDPADGTLRFVPTDHTPGSTPVVTGTTLAGRGVNSLAEALLVAVSDLASAEDAVLAAGTRQIPQGVDASFSINGAQATINATLPFSVSVNTSGQQVLSVTNYLA